MARSLYRFYLYTIFIALVIFAVVVTAQLLSTLFALTPLRGTYDSPPTHAELVQSLVFAIVGWIISGTLGGLHYWLIRRDQRSDPSAGASAIRSFFLNATEATGVLMVVSLIGFSVLGTWAYTEGGGSSSIGVALPTLAMVLLLEWERRRFPAAKGAALVFQRLHFFGVQSILVALLAGVFINNTFRPLISLLFFGGQGQCSGDYCPSYNATGLTVMLLWFIAGWLVYCWLTRDDSSRIVRMIMHGSSLAFGAGWTLYGVFVAFELILRALFKLPVTLPDILGISAAYDFVSPLVLGILITSIYHLLLRDVSQRGLLEQSTRWLTEWAIGTVLLAGTFWGGAGYGLYNLLQTIAPSPAAPDSQAWVTTLALLITGLSYIPLDLYIRRRFALDPAGAMGPRRGLVLALLAAGIMALAIGGSVALYAWGTSLFGSPITNWPQIAHAGLATAIVGTLVIGIYIWPVRGEHLLSRPAKIDQPPIPETPTTPATIESILDELLAGRLSREEAATRIRALSSTPALVVG